MASSLLILHLAWLLGLVGNTLAAPPRYSCTSSQPLDIDASIPGEIVSPGFPGKYPDNQDCIWKLNAPLGSVVRVKITTMNLEQHDTLTLFDGTAAYSGNVIGKYSLCMKGSLSLFSTGMGMIIKFTSNARENEEGFKIEYKSVGRGQIVSAGRVNKICSFKSVERGTSGYIGSPGFPNSLPQSTRCIWQVFGPKDKSLHFSYISIGLVPDPFGECSFDFVRHLFSTSKKSKKYCGCSLPPVAKGNIGESGFIQLYVGKPVYHQTGFLVYFKATDPSICADKDSCPALKDDRDVGFDRYANIKYEKKEQTTPAPETPTEKVIIERIGPFDVHCSNYEMKVALNHSRFPLLEQQSATLLDPNCKAYNEDGTHVFIKTSLDGCGTYHNYSKDGRYIIYYNQVIMQLKKHKPGDVITRDHMARFDFDCRYHRKMVMSVVHFTPSRGQVYSQTENFGNFTFMMRMFKSDKYKVAYDKYPVYVWASKKVYIQTEVRANDSDLILLVDKCHATPSEDPNDKEFYDLLTDGCPLDETFEYNHKVSAVQRFNFKAFYLTADKDATVHLHCKVRVCRKVDKNSRCVKGCPHGRRRRATSEDHDENEFTVSIGPLKFQEEAQSGKQFNGERMFIEIVIGVLGVCIVVLLVAVVVVVWKRRQQQAKTLRLLVAADSTDSTDSTDSQ